MKSCEGVTKRRSNRIQELKFKKIKEVIMAESNNFKPITDMVESGKETPENVQNKEAILLELENAMFEAYNVLDHFLAIDVSYADTKTALTGNDKRKFGYVETKHNALLNDTKSERIVLYALTKLYSEWFDNNNSHTSINNLPLVQTHIKKLASKSKSLKNKLWEHHYRIKKYYGREPSLDSVLLNQIHLNSTVSIDTIEMNYTKNTIKSEDFDNANLSEIEDKDDVVDDDDIVNMLAGLCVNPPASASTLSKEGGKSRRKISSSATAAKSKKPSADKKVTTKKPEKPSKKKNPIKKPEQLKSKEAPKKSVPKQTVKPKKAHK